VRGFLSSSLALFLNLVCTLWAASLLLAAQPMLPLAAIPDAERSVAPVFPVSHVDVDSLLAFAASAPSALSAESLLTYLRERKCLDSASCDCSTDQSWTQDFMGTS